MEASRTSNGNRMLSDLVKRLTSWHTESIAQSWHSPLRMNRFLFLSALVCAAIAMSANVYVRCAQSEIWKSNPEMTEIVGAMSFSTADAPYFLGQAASLKRYGTFANFEKLRTFPNSDIESNSDEEVSRIGRLLPTLISYIAKSAEPADLLEVAHSFTIIAAALTSLMIVFAFGAAGYWLEGSVASLGGGLSYAFLPRSSFGRIDTDQLNLGLFYLLFGTVLLAGRASSGRASLFWCITAGLVAKIFMYWYGKEELIWMAFIALTWLFLVLRRKLKTTLIGLSAFYIIADLPFSNPLNSSYVQSVIETTNFFFPNTYGTISEVAQFSFWQILVSTSGSIEMGLVCLLGLLLAALRHPVIAVAYGPLAGFALFNFVIGNRAIFFSAPMMWFGFAFIVTTFVRSVADRFHESTSSNRIADKHTLTTFLATILALLIGWVNSPTNYVPKPSFEKKVLEAFTELKEAKSRTDIVVASWWDYGYASMFLNELPTIHDGGRQNTPSTHFFARALLSPQQSEMVGILRFLAKNKYDAINDFDSVSALEQAWNSPNDGPLPDIYLVLTNQMSSWMSSISKLGNWDIENGKPLVIKGNNAASEFSYLKLNCQYSGFPETLHCGRRTFDMRFGLVNGMPELIGWSHAKNGQTIQSRWFAPNGQVGLQTHQVGNKLTTQMMPQQLFLSSFNQLFHLGQINQSHIELYHDGYPEVRVFKIKGQLE